MNFPIGKRDGIFVVKPDGVNRDLERAIESELKQRGFNVLYKQNLKLSRDDVKLLYRSSFRRDYPLGENDPRAEMHIDFMTSGCVTAFLVTYSHCLSVDFFDYCKLVRGSSWIAQDCEASSLRYIFKNADFDNYEAVFEDGYLVSGIPENVIHAALSYEEMVCAFEVFFSHLVRSSFYVDKQFLRSRKSIDLLFVISYVNSSSENMDVKMHSGVSHLISFLQQSGFNVDLEVITGKNYHQEAQKILAKNPSVIAYSTVSSEFHHIACVSEAVAELEPNLLQVGGGTHFTLFPQDIYSSALDGASIGEGEYFFQDLLNGHDLSTLSGAAYRSQNGLVTNPTRKWIDHISDLPGANYKIWDRYKSQKEFPHRRIIISRGCPYACTYCSNKELSKMSDGQFVRFRSPESIECEIKEIDSLYPHVDTIFLETECLLPQFANTEGIFELTKFYKNRFSFGTNLRISSFNDSLLEEMFSCGFKFANLGIESGSERVRRDILKRNYSNDEVRHIFSVAHKVGLKINTYNLIGLPTETPEEFEETIKLNQEINPHEAQVYMFQPYPGTALYHSCLEEGSLTNPYYHHHFEGKERKESILNLKQFPPQVLIEKYNKFRKIFG
jgi:radical SAM superfamily enzyme YgiQ (UPF0313 family)/nucleoside diphosphate kinase